MSGGTLQYSSNNNHDFSGRFSTGANQAYKIDVNGRPVTYATALASSGGSVTLTDTAGGGSLTLSAANSFTGVVDIGGSLVVTSLNVYGANGPLGNRLASAETATGDGIGLHFTGGTLKYAGSGAQTTGPPNSHVKRRNRRDD